MDEVVIKAVSLVAIVVIGYAIKRLGWVKQEHFSVLSVIVLRITLPAALITSFNDFTISEALAWLIVVGLLVNLIPEVVAWWSTRRQPPAERGFALLHAGSYNVGAFAMPYTAQFVGPVAMVYTALFDIGNSIAAAGVGYSWGMALAGGKRLRFGRLVLTMLRSPVFDVYLTLLLLRLIQISFPAPVIAFTSLVGQANPFCAMLMIGIGLEVAVPRRTWARAVVYLARRYAFVIGFCLIIWYLLPVSVFPPTIKTVLIVVLWAPVAAMTAGFTDEAGGDVQLSALVTSLSIIVAIVMMPTVYVLLG